MASINPTNNGKFYKVRLSQAELNTIALLLGNSSDSLVVERAEDNEITTYCIDDDSSSNPLSRLYNTFYSKMKNEGKSSNE